MSTYRQLHPRTVRGRIRRWLATHCAQHLGDDVLEVGSRRHFAGAWWTDNRDLVSGAYLGLDIQEGEGVDVVGNVEKLPRAWTGRFSGIICSEVLEHVQRPWKAIDEMARCLRPGGALAITTLFAFPEHGFPNDYWRFTRTTLDMLLEGAGLERITTAYDGVIVTTINDHGEPRDSTVKLPMHVFAIAFKPQAPSDHPEPDNDGEG